MGTPPRILLIGAALLAGCNGAGPTGDDLTPVDPAPNSHSVRYAEERFLRSHDQFISADRPALVAAHEVTFLEDDDEVLGFVLDGEARAYDVRALCYHHVVNDFIGTTPIAVTY